MAYLLIDRRIAVGFKYKIHAFFSSIQPCKVIKDGVFLLGFLHVKYEVTLCG